MADESKTAGGDGGAAGSESLGVTTKSENGNLTTITVTTAEFDRVLEAQLGHPRLFALFTGAIKEETGKSWCVCLARVAG